MMKAFPAQHSPDSYIIHLSHGVNLPEFCEDEMFPCLLRNSHDMAIQVSGMRWPAIMLYTTDQLSPAAGHN